MSDVDEAADSIALSRHEEESLRLKTLAEQNYTSGDLKSAMNYANRAHELHPSLDALPELITAFQILTAAEDTRSLDSSSLAPDYYKILQTERFAHPNSIKKQYKALALALHPDKNPFPASAEAFKLVGEASHVLSDKNRRKEYDTRLRISMQSETTEEVGLAEKFWTSCSACLLLHQMERKYIGHSLVCPSCKKNFKAMEVKEDSNDGVDAEKSSIRVSARIRDRNARGASLGMVERCGLGVKRKISSIEDVLQRSGRVENSVNGEEEEDDDDTMTLSQLKVLVKKEKRQVEEKHKDVGNGGENGNEEVQKNELKTYKRRVRKDHNNAEIINVPSSTSPQHSEKDDSEVLQVEMDGKREKRERQRVSKYGNNFKVTEIGKSKSREDSEFERIVSTKKGNLEIMPVEDSEFHDFDKDRTGRSFRKGQVWALYDDADGMPRHYGLIDKIVSVKPFEVNLYWLLFQTNGDEELINRRKMGFCISCGSFKVSKRVSIKYLNLFSHVVGCEKASREIYRIYPTKGSVWGLYRDNNPNSNKRCYDIVICLSGYSEVHGLSIGYLQKVPGFRTVFKRKEIGANAVICLGKSDVRLLSHEIPAKKLSGQEDLGLPKDCWELDPASLAQLLIGDIVE